MENLLPFDPNLWFDPVKEIDTALAEQYIKEHEHFEIEPPKDRCFVFSNGSDMEEYNYYVYLNNSKHNTNSINHKIRKTIVEKLKEKYELFCQLEYLIRKTDAEVTRKQLNLISSYAQCDLDTLEVLIRKLVNEDIPLYELGSIIFCQQSCLITTMKTAPLCHLFYEVCLQSGIKTSLVYINADDIIYGNRRYILDGCTKEGCAAVYTERADIDSAVDVLLYSSPQAPWSIRRVFVQESVYERVVAALSAKGRRMAADDRPTQYLEAFETRRGIVAVTVGSSAPDVVRVLTYRTVRDLLSLLGTSPFLSLWCEDAAQANELASLVTSNYVWINGYADFDGPPELALAVYDVCSVRNMEQTCCDHIVRLIPEWSPLPSEERKSIVLDVLDKFASDNSSKSSEQSEENESIDILEVYRSIENWKPRDQVQMQSDKITIIVDRPDPNSIYKFNISDLVNALKCVIRGYGTCVICREGDLCQALISNMILVDIPLLALDSVSDFYSIVWSRVKPGITFLRKTHPGKKKVIQTTFGTIM